MLTYSNSTNPASVGDTYNKINKNKQNKNQKIFQCSMFLTMISLLIFIFLDCSLVASGSPYDDFLSRADEYKNRAFNHPNCGWWQDILRLHFQHENFCEDGLLSGAVEVDDFEMAGVAWITMMEWDNPLLTDRVRNTLLSRLTTMPWWLDEKGCV